VGGAIGTGAHGSSLRHPPCLSDQVVSVSIVDGLGVERNITDPKELQAFRLHLGLLGIVTSVTLRTVPLYKMRGERTVQPDTILLDGTALRMAEEHDTLGIAWFPGQEKVVVIKGDYLNDTSTPGNAYSNLIIGKN
jgi:L-gulonolactone oxidase